MFRKSRSGHTRRSWKTQLRTIGLVLAIGLAPLLLGGIWMYNQAESKSLDDQSRALEETASSEAESIRQYFSQARGTILITSRNPAFASYRSRAGSAGPHSPQAEQAREPAEDALAYLERLYPDSIGEACFIDHTGTEMARVVTGDRAHSHDLSDAEAETPFWAPTMKQRLGEVYQAAPYESPDTHEWVISNSTLVPVPKGEPKALVHFEVTIESFRRLAANRSGDSVVSVVDASTGKVILSSDRPQEIGEPLGGNRSFPGYDLIRANSGPGVIEHDGRLIAHRRVAGGVNNANDWIVVAAAPVVADGILLSALAPLGGMVLALVLLGSVIARRWTEMTISKTERVGQARLLAAVRDSGDMVSIVGDDGRITMQTGATVETVGHSPPQLLNTDFLELCHPDDREMVSALLAGYGRRSDHPLDARFRHADGSVVPVELTATNLEDGGGTVITARDISARKEIEDQLRHRAFHDPLTGLANRALFQDRVDHALAPSDDGDWLVAALLADLDDFKQINDRDGHQLGDEVLMEAGRRLRSAVGEGATVARLGGDEFGILVERVESRAEVKALARSIIALFDEPMVIGDATVPVSLTLGYASVRPGGGISEDLLRRADLAMYAQKQLEKGGFAEFSNSLKDKLGGQEPAPSGGRLGRNHWFASESEQREQVITLLETPGMAIPVFQPLLDLRLGTVRGYEALTRFSDGRVPNAWFEQAHRCGLGDRLEALTLEASIKAGRSRPEEAFLSLNVSPTALASEEVAAVLPENLEGLVLEITENELVLGGPRLSESIAVLRERGALIAIDDAGAGYAGLKHLTTLEPDIIKLDRGLIDGIDRDPAKIALLDAFVRFAGKIGAEVCAEGIERAEELCTLADLDTALGQGYFIAKPGPGWLQPSAESVREVERVASESMSLSNTSGSGSSDRALELASARFAQATGIGDLQSALETIAPALGADGIAISALDRASWSVRALAVSGVLEMDERDFSLDEYPLTARVLGTGAAAQVLAGDLRSDSRERELLDEEGLGSVLIVPILFGGSATGLLEFYSREERPWSRVQLARARLISHAAGIALVKLTPDGMERSSDAAGSELLSD